MANDNTWTGDPTLEAVVCAADAVVIEVKFYQYCVENSEDPMVVTKAFEDACDAMRSLTDVTAKLNPTRKGTASSVIQFVLKEAAMAFLEDFHWAIRRTSVVNDRAGSVLVELFHERRTGCAATFKQAVGAGTFSTITVDLEKRTVTGVRRQRTPGVALGSEAAA